jgi:hypothetical protein
VYRFGSWEAAMARALGVASEGGVARDVQPAAFRQHDDPLAHAKTDPPPAFTAPALPIDPADEATVDAMMARRRASTMRTPAAQRAAFVAGMDPRPHMPRITASVEPADPVAAADDRSRHAKLKAEHARLVDMLREERERNAFMGQLHRATQTPKILRSERASGLREMTAVAMASDWHVEEPVDPVKVAHRNEYSLAIADDRIRRFFQGCIDLVEHHRADGRTVVRDMVLAFSGDLMSGYIHPELQETNDLSPIETALWLQPRIRDGIATLLERLQLRSILVPWSHGNHGRVTQKSRISTGSENSFEWMLGRTIEREFASDPRVQFDTSPSAHQYVQAYDFTLHFHHGDSLKYQGGVGGLGIPLLKAVPAWDDIRYAHVHHVGHWHQLRDYGRVMVNGSLIGYGPYSSWIRAPFEPPQQMFYLLDSKRAKCHVTPLWVGEIADEARAA